MVYFTQIVSILLPILYWRRNGSWTEAGKVVKGQLIIAGTRLKSGSTSTGLPALPPYVQPSSGGSAGFDFIGPQLGPAGAGSISGGSAGELGAGQAALGSGLI